jgi:hypothetical protein
MTCTTLILVLILVPYIQYIYVDIVYLLGGTAGCFLLVGTGGACFPDPPPSILCLLVGTTGGTDAQEVTKASGMDEGKRLITFLPNNTII